MEICGNSDMVQNVAIIKLSLSLYILLLCFLMIIWTSMKLALLYTPSKLVFDKSSSDQCLYSDSIRQLAPLLPIPIYLTEELIHKACTTQTRLKNTFLSYTPDVSYSKELLKVLKNNLVQVSVHCDTPGVVGF